jgi:hypothetical protein
MPAQEGDGWSQVTAWATVAAAGLVLVQLLRESWREYVRRRTVNARIDALAYKVRRQLRSWVGSPEDGTEFEQWIRDRQNDRSFGRHLDRAEEHLDNLMALRPDAQKGRGPALDLAFVLFLEWARRLNEYVDTPRPGPEGHFDWVQLRLDAEKDIRECIAQLERHVISRSLLAQEALLTKTRIEGSVLAQEFADEGGDPT